MKSFTNKFLVLLLLLFPLRIWSDVGIFEMQKDQLYFSEMNNEKTHLQQYYNSESLDYLNISEIRELGFGKLSLFNPSFYSSFNSSTPSEINDGALWQGKGVNGQFETGFKFTSKYLDIRFIPKVWFSQNQDFSLVPSAYYGEDSERGKYGSIISGMDQYQRPGSSFYYEYDLGKTSVMLKYSIFELEFSTDNFILGPSRISPLIMSDNSAGFPHARIGFDKWETFLGVFEYNAIWGGLKESDFFDNDSSNDDTLVTALNIGYSPAILPGFTIGINRTLIASMKHVNPGVVFKIFDPFIAGGVIGDKYGYDKTDQRFSLVFDWSLPESGFRIYTELAKNDYSTDYELFLRTPEHAGAITAGFSKTLGRFLLEFEYTEMIESRDYDLGQPVYGTFYKHHIVTSGYTNRGQLMGAGIGSGSDAQTLTLSYFADKYQIKGYFQRIGIMKDYIYGEHYVGKLPNDPEYPVSRLQFDIKAGISTLILYGNYSFFAEVAADLRFAYNYDPDEKLYNFFGAFGIQYKF